MSVARLMDDLIAYQRGQTQPLLTRIQRQQLALDDILTIQSYLENPRSKRRVARKNARGLVANNQALLWYTLFLHFNLIIAKQEIACGAPYRPFKIRMYVLKFVARKCTHHNRSLAWQYLRYGRLVEGWPQLAELKRI